MQAMIIEAFGGPHVLKRLEPILDKQLFTFAEAAAAHRKLQAGRAIGKIALKARF